LVAERVRAGRLLNVRRPESLEFDMTELNKDEKVVVARTSFNVANTIAAIALLALVFGLLKYLGVSPI
jgi:Na+/phosphate symporter